ncbi:MAG: hypothetical protein GPJ51_11200 [Candidatus Heimdallarchaeota archaeon]|nr:hypothetical protein [Candidatus Heimdallarchaeota archaeon]
MSKDFCQNCGKAKGNSTRCDFCGFREEKQQPQISTDKNEIRKIGVWLSKCPVCKFGQVNRFTKKVFFNLIKKKFLECESCGAIFSQFDSKNYRLKHVMKTSSEVWKLYGGVVLSEREWKNIAVGGMSNRLQRKTDIELWEKKFSNGEVSLRDTVLVPEDFSSENPPIILKKNEELLFAFRNITLQETRMVSNRKRINLGTIGIVKVAGYVGGSKPEMRKIDVGVLCLTSNRLVFAGRNKNVISQLDKIMKIDEYYSGISIAREGKTKTQFYTGDAFNKDFKITIEGRGYVQKLSPSRIIQQIQNLVRF